MIKLFALLKIFSTKEIKLFRQFVESPYFNKRSDVVKLLIYWDENRRNFSKEKAYEYVFSEKKFNTQNWHLLTSRLFKLGEQFLAVNEILKNDLDTKILLGKAYRKKKLTPFFQSTFKDVKKKLEQQIVRDGNWLQQNFIIENEFYDYIASHDRKVRTNLQAVNNTLDKYYFSNKLKTACLAISRRTINQEQYEISWIEEILQQVESSKNLLEEPIIAVYFYCYKIRTIMTQFKNRFPPAERRDILLLAINYYILRVNTGSPIYIQETLKLYQLGLDEGVLLEDGVLPESTFSNVMMIYASLKEFDQAYQFIEDYRKYLKPAFQNPLYFYSLGKLHYEQGRYDDSLRSLAQVDTKASFLLLGAKTLQLKIFYELNEIDALESLLDTLRVYLQRRKDLGYRKENYENLIFFVRKLLEKSLLSKKEKEKLKEEVNAKKVFTEKAWVLQQIDT